MEEIRKVEERRRKRGKRRRRRKLAMKKITKCIERERM